MRDVGEALLEGKSLGLYPTSAYSLKQSMQKAEHANMAKGEKS